MCEGNGEDKSKGLVALALGGNSARDWLRKAHRKSGGKGGENLMVGDDRGDGLSRGGRANAERSWKREVQKQNEGRRRPKGSHGKRRKENKGILQGILQGVKSNVKKGIPHP